MEYVKRWNIEVSVVEEGRETHAEARLYTTEAQPPLIGEGRARCNVSDDNVPQIGDELAVARALADLSRQLARMTATDIESMTHEPAFVRV
ncbi:DUF1876 domain-containing protein [Actinoalloteichus spitiensis]|uniref:DUF1876 domain-containing protein n=1 Tax=Actinoalloteichus spitiensis TaxID=252394 RepID=UPI000368AD6A|nr:DUF1876 domain-containing protein [Actinoalloteichus spitiensis]